MILRKIREMSLSQQEIKLHSKKRWQNEENSKRRISMYIPLHEEGEDHLTKREVEGVREKLSNAPEKR